MAKLHWMWIITLLIVLLSRQGGVAALPPHVEAKRAMERIESDQQFRNQAPEVVQIKILDVDLLKESGNGCPTYRRWGILAQVVSSIRGDLKQGQTITIGYESHDYICPSPAHERMPTLKAGQITMAYLGCKKSPCHLAAGAMSFMSEVEFERELVDRKNDVRDFKAPVVSVSTSVPQAVLNANPAPLVGAINDFGFDLLAQLPRDGGWNTIISPISLHAALSMTAAGAKGTTARQMQHVLRLDRTTLAESAVQWSALIKELNSRDGGSQLLQANGLWVRQDVQLSPAYVDASRRHFGAELASLDFASPKAAERINAWVAANTRGMVAQIIDRTSPDTLLYLTNATYFKGEWQSPFLASDTRSQPFTRANGSRGEVRMMRSTMDLPYADNRHLQAIRLTYRGYRTAFYVMLPKPGSNSEKAIVSLRNGGFVQLRADMDGELRKITLGLPKLDTEFTVQLVPALDRLGMRAAFDPSQADFSAMRRTGPSLMIGEVLHKTRLRIDELGSEAAAATVVQMRLGSTPEKPLQLICDRPWLFAIVDEPSGAILFLGRVEDPAQR